ncbi:site-specific integrase, partial [Citricoccus sp. NPDC055426]
MSRRTRPGDRRRSFGQVAQLPSGRFRARYTGPDGKRRTGPATFATRAEADAYLVQVHAEMLRGNTLAVAPT